MKKFALFLLMLLMMVLESNAQKSSKTNKYTFFMMYMTLPIGIAIDRDIDITSYYYFSDVQPDISCPEREERLLRDWQSKVLDHFREYHHKILTAVTVTVPKAFTFSDELSAAEFRFKYRKDFADSDDDMYSYIYIPFPKQPLPECK